jgi:hypothetical protein
VDELTSDTGGMALYANKPEQVVPAIESIALLMRRGYQIGLNGAFLPRDGKYHEITVTVGSVTIEKGKTPYIVNAPRRFLASN